MIWGIVYEIIYRKEKSPTPQPLPSREGSYMFRLIITKHISPLPTGEGLGVGLLSYFFSTNDIPGRRPSILSIGRAFTSKVLRSYCPFDLVAFHTAYEPWSLM